MIEQIVAFFKGGTSKFFETELFVLNTVIKALPANDAVILKKQIDVVSLVQRPMPGKLITAYYPKKLSVPSLPYSGYEYCIAKLIYRSQDKQRIIHVVLHEGKLMSLEGNVPLKNDCIDEIISVELHPNDYKSIVK